MDLDELRSDLAAFADDEQEVVVEPSGNFILARHGRDVTGRFVETPDGALVIARGDQEIPYRKFLTHELANLPTLAERLMSRRHVVSSFIDGVVDVRRPAEDPSDGRAMAVLRQECEDPPSFAARISFITADAGHGKTALLREYQYRQADAFLNGQSSYVFWHLDLQGRQLLRLSEALMGDLGELRVTGLWMPSLIRLMRHRALVLAIDGFDELAAEQGGTDALGALASLVTQLAGRGIVVAAARRTFFDTEDYLRRAGMVGRAITSPCQFDQVSLRPWDKAEATAYLASKAPSGVAAKTTYDRLLTELGGEASHPMLTRPFLVAQLARALYEFGIDPADFIRSADDPLSGVATVVEAFVRREVAEKWKFRDTGEAYLTEDQHMQLLGDIAEEMYRSQKDRLSLDLIETLATLLLDQWEIDASKRQQIIDMVKMHVLLVPPADGDSSSRGFDHPEFRDYFTAYALRGHLERVMAGVSAVDLARFLSIAQISDSTARYVCNMIPRSEENVRSLANALQEMVAREWRPTFLQVNVGTLLPFLISDIEFEETLMFAGNAIFTSLVFERTMLRNVILKEGSFVNASLNGANWSDVTLEACNLGELSIDDETVFRNVRILDCPIEGLKIREGDEEVREYAPDRIWLRLVQRGAIAADQGMLPIDDEELGDTPDVKIFRRILRMFLRSTVVSEHMINQRFKADTRRVTENVLPLMEQHGLLSERAWRGAGTTRIWALECRAEDVLAAEYSSIDPRMASFWRELKRIG